MQPARRDFLIQTTALSAASLLPSTASAVHAPELSHNTLGVLVDLNDCIGCRLCEYACKKDNGIDPGPLKSYDDQSVFRVKRRMGTNSLTVLNSYDAGEGKKVFVKNNCLHCNHPACASACIVGALQKQENGAVVYDAWKCIGCRYCMVACPFQVPTYEYDKALTPRVRKCEFCYEKHTSRNEPPACVKECPRQAMIFGRREKLLELAHRRISSHPEKYVDHVYGEHEVGGTSWMYLAPVEFEKAGFPKFGPEAPPALTEKIQHGVFKFGVPPLTLYGLLGGLMFFTGRRTKQQQSHHPGRLIEDDHHDEHAAPVNRSLLTPGVWMMLALMAIGLLFGAYRFIYGLGASTNLNQQYPWGIWIAVDVASGVALAAGGFTTAFLAHVLNRRFYHAILRPALLTAMLGYTFVVLGLQADLGRYYNVWHPLIMWQGNSVLFEVGMCVMCYLNVLYLEFAPIFCQWFIKRPRRFPRLSRWAGKIHERLERIMFLLIIAGCCLSCLHQSSLGNLLVIAPYKLHPLWWTPLSALLFLLSAIAVGFPMVIWESLVASWSLKLKSEIQILSRLARFVPFTLGLYLAVKVGDLIYRGAYVHLAHWSLQSICWMVEVGFGVVVPMAMLCSGRVRRSPRWLLTAATLVVLGVVFNRINVFIIGYHPPYSSAPYIPSIAELAVTIGLIATLMFCYRLIVTYFPVISHHDEPPHRRVIRAASQPVGATA